MKLATKVMFRQLYAGRFQANRYLMEGGVLFEKILGIEKPNECYYKTIKSCIFCRICV